MPSERSPFDAKAWDYELRAWIGRLGSMPVEIVASEDRSQSYEMDRFHVFRLENRAYASVLESGCSCYEVSEAVIDLHRTKKEAMAALDAWRKSLG